MRRCLRQSTLLSAGLMIVALNAPADEAELRRTIHHRALRTAGVLHPQWLADPPIVVLPGQHNAVDPLLIPAVSGTLVVVAESREGDSSTLLLSTSADNGSTWEGAREVQRASAGRRLTAGAGGVTPQGSLVLALHEWQDTSGEVVWLREEPRGVHHYGWSGFRLASKLSVLLSEDEGATWSSGACDMGDGPIAPSAMGKVFATGEVLWLAVYGPANETEMDAALSGVGLMRSDDGGQNWRFSHWVAPADKEQAIAYGPGEIAVLPDVGWVAMLEGHPRDRGDYAQPRISRTVSLDGGKTWSRPQAKMLGPTRSWVMLGQDRIMVGSWYSGVMFNIFVDAGERFLYQGYVWGSIGGGPRGGLRLSQWDEKTVRGVYHWMEKPESSRTEVRYQVLRNRVTSHSPAEPAEPEAKPTSKPTWQWVMAEAHQVPDMADAPAGLRTKTLLKLRSGDWMCIGLTGTTQTGEAAYGFGASGLCVMRSPAIEGPWRKVADLTLPKEVGVVHDPGTGAGMPGHMTQHSSGRLFLPLSAKNRQDIILMVSDDEGRTWDTAGSMTAMTGLPDVREADIIVEQKEGEIVFPMVTGAGWEPGVVAHPFYVRSTDQGRTWSEPVFWATHPGTHYTGLSHGRAGDLRETALAIVSPNEWLGIYREERGSPIPEDYEFGPIGMPQLNLAYSENGGRTWKSAFGFVGVEPALATTPDGTVFCAHRQYGHGSVWISYDGGRTWQEQDDPVEMPWGRAAAQAHGQWPPGGSSSVRVLDEETVVVISDTGISPSGKTLPPGYQGSRELHGRAQVRFFRRVPADERG